MYANGGTYIDDVLCDTGLVTLGRFRADPGHPAFHDSGPTERPIFVFPRTSVVIRHDDKPPFTTDTCTVTYYNEGQRYTREPVDPRGDRCEWFSVRPDALLEALTVYDPAAVERPEHPFEFAYGPSDPATYALQRIVVHHVQGESLDESDSLAIDEAVVDILDRLLRLAFRDRPGSPAAANGVAQRVRRFLVDRYRDDVRLEDVAIAGGCSVFHLCRVFRRETGTTVHRYRHQLRLRHSLELVAEPDSDLTNVAFHLGFSSHSHFTAAFRDAFDTTPSEFRRVATGRRIREMTDRLFSTG